MAWICLALIAGVNIYIVREMFAADLVARWNSMQGYWVALARMAGGGWLTPSWWPYWDCGMPLEHTYAPLIPGLTSAVASVAGIPHPAALHRVMGFFYCLAPVTLFVLVWRWGRSVGAAVAAAGMVSLISPVALLVPDQPFAWSRWSEARNLYLVAVWDELPHYAALALLPLAVLAMVRYSETGRPRWLAGAVLASALTVVASLFGATLLVLSAACLWGTMGRRATSRLLLTGIWTYLLVCPFLTPSLMAAVRRAAEYHGQGWQANSGATFAGVAAGAALLAWLLHRVTENEPARFAVLFFAMVAAVVGLAQWAGRSFVPQPLRYKVEFDFAAALLVPLLLLPLGKRLPRWAMAAGGIALACLAVQQVESHRAWAKEVLKPVPVERSIEFRAAQWMAENLPGRRVLLPGSIAQWTNAFTGQLQFSGGSWSTAVNLEQQKALWSVLSARDADAAARTLAAYGVEAVLVPGPKSPEFWKPFEQPGLFEGRLEVLWREEDTTIYRAPGRMPPIAWRGPNRGLVELEGAVVAVPVTYHPGWRATNAGRTVPIERNLHGLMNLRLDCPVRCRVELAYDGGWELRAARWVALAALLFLVAAARSDSLSWHLGRGVFPGMPFEVNSRFSS